MKLYRYLVIFVLTFINNVSFGQMTSDKLIKYPTKDLKEDFSVYRKQLETKNPITYLYNSKSKITTYLDSIESLIDKPMTEIEFYQLISPVSSLTNDGHNLIMPSSKVISYLNEHPYNLPLEIAMVNKELLLKESYNGNTNLELNSVIKAINGVSTSSIVERLYIVLPREGNQIQLPTYTINRWFRFFYHLHYGFSENYVIEYTDNEELLKKTTIKGATLNDIFEKRKSSFERSNLNGIYTKIIDDNTKTALLNVPTFSPTFLKEHNQAKFKKEIDKCFNYILENEINHLIIDLRENGGGNPDYSVYLLKHLFDKPFTQAIEARVVKNSEKEDLLERTSKKWFPWYGIGTFKPKKKNYKGKIYVITSGGTFSAAVEFATTLKKYDRATFIGEETGGNAVIIGGNYFKESRKLPNTKMLYYSGSLCTIYNDLNINDGRGIVPDYPIVINKANFHSKTDYFLDKTLLLINLSEK